MADFYEYDEALRAGGLSVAGIDEVGRGPLAGPVVAAAVVMPSGLRVPYLMDSKRLSKKRMESVFFALMDADVDFGLGVVDSRVIDEINILSATRRAMMEAVADLRNRPCRLVIDAVRLPELDMPQESPCKGEDVSASVAAASVVAKVLRDALMIELHGRYPAYGFDGHKGYGTRAHVEAILRHGPSPVHRMSFLGGILSRLPF